MNCGDKMNVEYEKCKRTNCTNEEWLFYDNIGSFCESCFDELTIIINKFISHETCENCVKLQDKIDNLEMTLDHWRDL